MTTRPFLATEQTSTPLTRIGATAGVAGPLLFTAGFVTQNVVRSDDDVIGEPVSALGAGGLGWVQSLNFVVLGVALLLLAAGLHAGIRATRLGWLGPALLGLAGCGAFVAASFPLDRDIAGEIYDPGLHQVGGMLFFLGSALALIVLSRRLAADPRWQPLRGYCLIAGLLALAGGVVLRQFGIPGDAPLHDYVGLIQRGLVVLVTFPCLVTLAARLAAVGRAPRT